MSSGEQPDSGRVSDTTTPARKEKKRVGWRNPDLNPDLTANKTAVDDFSTLSPGGSPKFQPAAYPHGAPDAQELSEALTRILSQEPSPNESTGKDVHLKSPQDSPPTGGGMSPLPSRPRPALRRNTSYDAPHEREEADKAESEANERVLRSITDARQRADQLAISLGSYSAPGSRRNSDDIGASFQHLVGVSDGSSRGRSAFRPAVVVDDYDAAESLPFERHGARATGLSTGLDGAMDSEQGGGGNTIRHRGPAPVDGPQRLDTDDSYDNHDVAAKLVRTHTRKRDLFHSDMLRGRQSGTSTPIIDDPDLDYVPRPKKYHGGVLSSLLKLYNDEQRHHAGGAGSGAGGGGGGSAGSSGRTTPAYATPSVSAQSSPSASRSSSRTRPARAGRPSSGLFSLHRSHGSASSLTLTELMKSSSMFAAPGSSVSSDRMAEKVKESAAPKKPKKDKYRITVHIAGILARHQFLIKLCKALMLYGAPTHRLEEYLGMSARALEIEAQFLYMPSCMIISFDDSTTHTTEMKIIRIRQGIDLGKLRDVHNIYKEVVHDKLGVEEATQRVDDVMNRKVKYHVAWRVMLYGVASACVAPFAFQGRFIDMPCAFLLGSLVGFLQLVLAPQNELYAHVFEVSASVLTSFLARAFGSINGGDTFCFGALAQSSIALILPGYMVLCSSLELQSYNIVAGSVRMVHALIYTLFLGYGITIGASLYGMIDPNASSEKDCREPLDRNWHFMFVPGFTLCLCLVNQAKWRQTPVMLLMSLAGWAVNSYCSQVFKGNNEISNMLGALTIGILANLYSRVGRHIQNAWYDTVDFCSSTIKPRLARLTGRKKTASMSWDRPSDPESRPGSPMEEKKPERKKRSVGYSLAAAAMLPAIFVQVPSGLAVGGSLLAGVQSADSLTSKNGQHSVGMEGTAFNVLFKVIQVAIGISVGLFMSALIVYPLGKRRSGLFSF